MDGNMSKTHERIFGRGNSVSVATNSSSSGNTGHAASSEEVSVSQRAEHAKHLAVCTACENGELKRVERLLDAKADVNGCPKDHLHGLFGAFRREIPLHSAVLQGRVEVAELLLSRKCDIEQRDDYPHATALWHAVNNDNNTLSPHVQLALVALLLSHGADVTARNQPYLDSQDKVTVLQLAKQQGVSAIVALCLEAAEARQKKRSVTTTANIGGFKATL